MKQLMSVKFLSGAFLIAQLGLISCGNEPAETETTETTTETSETSLQQAMATLNGTMPDTALNGTAQFVQQGDKVKMNLQLSIPSKANQSVAVHIHEHGDCGDMGKGAHGHWNPTNKNHGKWGSDNFHSGDIGNVSLDANGNGSIEMETDLWTIGGDAQKDILNKAIIVHAGTDDYTSQPAGNAGDRIGCGVIQQGNQ